MDLKGYYRRIRELEASIEAADVVVVSQETPDGGKAGVKTETPRLLAAQMVVEGKARLATAEETAQYAAEKQEAKRQADEKAASQRVRVALLSEAELLTLTGGVLETGRAGGGRIPAEAQRTQRK